MAISPLFTHPSPSPSPSSSRPPKKTELISKQRSELQAALLSLDSHSINGKSTEERRALYHSLISLCISTRSIHEGRRLRSHLTRTGFPPGLFLDNQFINLYSRCGEVDTARQFFHDMQQRNVVSWNAMIAAYCSNDHFVDALRLFQLMIETGPAPDQPTYLSALRASVGSRNLRHGQQIHARLVKQGILSSIQLGNALISMYSKLGQHRDAEAAFESMAEQDEASWNSLIAANAKETGSCNTALELFVEMQRAGLTPNEFTFGSLLGSKELAAVQELHSQIVRRGLGGNVFTGSALLDAYARRKRLHDGLLVFDMMLEKNNVAWNSAIAACFDSGIADKGLRLFLEMGEEGLIPDEYTVSILLKAAAAGLSAAEGRQFHGIAVKLGSRTDTLIGNNLIAMYGEHRARCDSWRAFQDITEPDLVTWNSMLQSCIKNDIFEQALTLFSEITCCGLLPDEFTFIASLAACTSLAWIQTGKGIHCQLIKDGLVPNAFTGSALIDMYAKCAAAADAKQVFDETESKDLIAWNSMIACLDQNCDLDEVLKLLCQLMREEELQPDNFTFTSALAATAKAASIQHGKQLHSLILKSELNPDAAVANALITMYTRSGNIKEAEKVFRRLKDKNVVSWTTMIGGYAQSGYSSLALKLLDEMEESGVAPNSKTFIALLTACSYAGLIEEGGKYFAMMEARYGIKPVFDHYACMVDILGRAGRLKEAEDFILQMPCEPDALVWRMLLSACRFYGDLERGKRAMENIVELEPGDSASYVLLSNLYAAFENWDDVLEVRQLMRDNGVKKEPGRSQIEVHGRVHEFLAGDCSHPQIHEVCSRLRELFKQMKDEEYDPSIKYVIS